MLEQRSGFGTKSTTSRATAGVSLGWVTLKALPNAEGEGDLKVNLPDADVEQDAEGMKIKGGIGIKLAVFKTPDIHLPSSNGKAKSYVSLPEGDVSVAAPSADINIKGGADIDLPEGEVELDVDGKTKKSGFEMPKFKMPHFGWSIGAGMPSAGAELDADLSVRGHKTKSDVKVDLPERGVSAKGPKVKSDVKVDLSEGDTSIRRPKVKCYATVDLPDADVKLDAEGKPIKSGFAIKMPKFKMPNTHLPSFKGPKVKGDVKVDLPDADVELDAEETPIKGGFGIKLPKFKTLDMHLPSSKGRAKSYVSLPEGDVSVAAPSADINIKGGADIDLPEGEVELDEDGEPKKGGIKMPKFKMPHFGWSIGAGMPSAGAELDADLSVKGPKTKGDVKVDLPEGDVSAKGPKVKDDVKVDLPEGDISIRRPKVKCYATVDLPDADVKLNAEGKPIKSGFGIKMPKFKLPDTHLPSCKGRIIGHQPVYASLTPGNSEGNKNLQTGDVLDAASPALPHVPPPAYSSIHMYNASPR